MCVEDGLLSPLHIYVTHSKLLHSNGINSLARFLPFDVNPQYKPFKTKAKSSVETIKAKLMECVKWVNYTASACLDQIIIYFL